ncbi:MAG TPA: FliM/FliN family flagellar motor C-terminal domain-containing protein [Candidatus Eremiobacteraceae bacterium]|nr:FliM/FliN family flagellar motor C-terminal domain-containing protein [Candidatus Eremiobacteraceae bacterium]
MTETIVDRQPRRWRAPLLAAKKSHEAVDETARALERLARAILAHVSQVITACTLASLGPLNKQGYADCPEVSDRAWRITHDQLEIFCVIDDVSERTLFGWIVGASPSRVLSSIERSIIAESIRRLVTTSLVGSHVEFRDEPRVRPTAGAWRCDVGLHGPGKATVTLQFFAECASPPQPSAVVCRPNLRNVALHLRAVLPAVVCSLHDVRAWRSGSLMRLQRSERDVEVTLYAGGRRLATAQLGTVFGERTLKLVSLGLSVGQ